LFDNALPAQNQEPKLYAVGAAVRAIRNIQSEESPGSDSKEAAAESDPAKTETESGESRRGEREVKKSELLRALQTEISKHDLGHFTDDKDRVVVPGCPTCKRRFNTVAQFVQHINTDVLPALLDKLATEERGSV
jgi:hypothetical protein